MLSRRSIAGTMMVISLSLAASRLASGQAPPRLDQYGRWVNGISEPWMFSESLPKENVSAVQQKWSPIESENQAAAEKQGSGNDFTGVCTQGRYLGVSNGNWVTVLR